MLKTALVTSALLLAFASPSWACKRVYRMCTFINASSNATIADCDILLNDKGVETYAIDIWNSGNYAGVESSWGHGSARWDRDWGSDFSVISSLWANEWVRGYATLVFLGSDCPQDCRLYGWSSCPAGWPSSPPPPPPGGGGGCPDIVINGRVILPGRIRVRCTPGGS
jgi:hypothetical protein